MKIALCCQYYNDTRLFDISLDGLSKYRVAQYRYEIEGHTVSVFKARSTNAFNGRNSCIYGSLELDIGNLPIADFDTWIFFDTDILWRERHILKMLVNRDDVFMYPYELRGSETKYNVALLSDKGYTHFDKGTRGSLNVDAGGAGALKFTRKVIEHIPPFAFMPSQRVVNGKLIPITSDYTFCEKAKNSGFSIVCDFNDPVKHIT